jgi:hypothetical protein
MDTMILSWLSRFGPLNLILLWALLIVLAAAVIATAWRAVANWIRWM